MHKELAHFYLSPDDPPAKGAMLVAALGLFATKGIDGVSVREIAARSGYTNPAMFKHFKTKEQLAKSLFESCYRRLVFHFAGNQAGLETALVGALELIEEAPESVHFVVENLRRFFSSLPADLKRHSLLGSMRMLIERERERGKIRADVDSHLAAALVLGLLAQIARMAYFHELKRRPPELAADLLLIIERGIGA